MSSNIVLFTLLVTCNINYIVFLCIGAEIMKNEIKRLESYMKYGTGVSTKRRTKLSRKKRDALAKARRARWAKVSTSIHCLFIDYESFHIIYIYLMLLNIVKFT